MLNTLQDFERTQHMYSAVTAREGGGGNSNNSMNGAVSQSDFFTRNRYIGRYIGRTHSEPKSWLQQANTYFKELKYEKLDVTKKIKTQSPSNIIEKSSRLIVV